MNPAYVRANRHSCFLITDRPIYCYAEVQPFGNQSAFNNTVWNPIYNSKLCFEKFQDEPLAHLSPTGRVCVCGHDFHQTKVLICKTEKTTFLWPRLCPRKLSRKIAHSAVPSRVSSLTCLTLSQWIACMSASQTLVSFKVEIRIIKTVL